MLGFFSAAPALVLGVKCLVETNYLQVLGFSEFFCSSSEVLGVNSYICYSFIHVIGVCRYCFCSFCEVLGIIKTVCEASGEC